jgi:hypothetical protein
MIDHWTIEPGVAMGPLKLGMTEVECVSLLGPVAKSFRRFKDRPEVTLAYDDAHLHLTVGASGTIQVISAFRPRTVILAGIQVLDRPMAEISAQLSSTGLKIERVDAGLWCRGTGVVLVEVDGMIDGVELSSRE